MTLEERVAYPAGAGAPEDSIPAECRPTATFYSKLHTTLIFFLFVHSPWVVVVQNVYLKAGGNVKFLKIDLLLK